MIKIGDGNVKPQDIGYVFQEPRLMPWLTVEKNIGFGLTGNLAARAAAIAEALELVGLRDARETAAEADFWRHGAAHGFGKGLGAAPRADPVG